jgi:outer membrane protein OmpA-like peptidoglycan-associated protein
MHRNPGLNMAIEGHTDGKGTEVYNQGLSEARARAVEGYLIKSGVAGSRLTSRSFGLSKPAAPNNTPEGRAKNRRVELHPVR